MHYMRLHYVLCVVWSGGGASLELVEGRGMPGLRALVRARHARAQQES